MAVREGADLDTTVDLGSFFGTPIQRVHDTQSGARFGQYGPGVQLYPTGESNTRGASLVLGQGVGVVSREIRIHWGAGRDVTESISLLSHDTQ